MFYEILFVCALVSACGAWLVRKRPATGDPDELVKTVFLAHFGTPLVRRQPGKLRGQAGRFVAIVRPGEVVAHEECWGVQVTASVPISKKAGRPILPGTLAALDTRCNAIESGTTLHDFVQRGTLKGYVNKTHGPLEVVQLIEEVQAIAADALTARSVPSLKQLEASIDSGDSRRAVEDFRALWELGDDGSLAAWNLMKASEVPALRVEAAVEIGADQAAALLAEDGWGSREHLRLVECLAQQPEAYVDVLAESMSLECPDNVRIRILEVAREMPDERFIAGLTAACCDPSMFVSNPALETLAAFPNETVNQVLAVTLTKLQAPLLLHQALELATLHGDGSLLTAIVAIRDSPAFPQKLRAQAEGAAGTIMAGGGFHGGSLSVFETPDEGALSEVVEEEVGQLSEVGG